MIGLPVFKMTGSGNDFVMVDARVSTPADWSAERRREYIQWGVNVVAGLRGVNAPLEDHFDKVVENAKKVFGP